MADVYSPPLRDIRFVFDHLVDAAGLAALPGLGHADVDTMLGLLQEFGRFCVEVLVPLNRVGDSVGARLDPDSGEVATPG